MKKINTWWSDDGKWFCMYVDDGASRATISLTPEEFVEFLKQIEDAHIAGIGKNK